jgi:hypothetical protein
MQDYSQATLADVPAIVETIQALREVGRRTETKTTKTQSNILRVLPADVLCAVALKLNQAFKTEGKAGGQ